MGLAPADRRPRRSEVAVVTATFIVARFGVGKEGDHLVGDEVGFFEVQGVPALGEHAQLGAVDRRGVRLAVRSRDDHVDLRGDHQGRGGDPRQPAWQFRVVQERVGRVAGERGGVALGLGGCLWRQRGGQHRVGLGRIEEQGPHDLVGPHREQVGRRQLPG